MEHIQDSPAGMVKDAGITAAMVLSTGQPSSC
jgi:hypothetical protein